MTIKLLQSVPVRSCRFQWCESVRSVVCKPTRSTTTIEPLVGLSCTASWPAAAAAVAAYCSAFRVRFDGSGDDDTLATLWSLLSVIRRVSARLSRLWFVHSLSLSLSLSVVMASLSEFELRALPRRDLQRLCRRDDVCRWRRIKANTKVSQSVSQFANSRRTRRLSSPQAPTTHSAAVYAYICVYMHACMSVCMLCMYVYVCC